MEACLLGNTSSRITPATDQGIGSTNDISVEETRGPDLARYESASKDTDKESDKVQAHCVLRSASEGSRDCAHEQQPRKGQTWAEVIAHWASHEAYKQCRGKGDDVGIGNLILGKVHVGFDTFTQLQRG